jgi:hypothetical protein
MRGVGLGDKRLERRLLKLMGDLAARYAVSLPQACGDWAATKAAYRFFDNEAVDAALVRSGLAGATAARIEGLPVVLGMSDTTSLDYSGHPATAGLGVLENRWRHGVLLHSVLAVSPDGVPLGVLWQQWWAREGEAGGQRATRKQRPTADKESQKWLTAEREAVAALAPETVVVTVGDRESDVFDLFAQPRRAGAHVLVRGSWDRRVEGPEQHLWAAAEAAPEAGRQEILVPGKDRLPERQAEVSVRFTTVALCPPRGRPKGGAAVAMGVVLVREEAPPPGAKPLEWLLLTTLPVGNAEEAWRCVEWYRLRWLVERYHYVLKSGCAVEKLQLRTVDRLERALACYSAVAWGVLWLTYNGRREPDAPASAVLAREEWQALMCYAARSAQPPAHAPTLGVAMREIAKLGGFLARKGDGEPGLAVIWRGLTRLHDITTAYVIFRAERGDDDVGNG